MEQVVNQKARYHLLYDPRCLALFLEMLKGIFFSELLSSGKNVVKILL